MIKDNLFDFRAGPIGHSVANVSPPLRRFFLMLDVAQARHAKETDPASAKYHEYTENLI